MKYMVLTVNCFKRTSCMMHNLTPSAPFSKYCFHCIAGDVHGRILSTPCKHAIQLSDIASTSTVDSIFACGWLSSCNYIWIIMFEHNFHVDIFPELVSSSSLYHSFNLFLSSTIYCKPVVSSWFVRFTGYTWGIGWSAHRVSLS